MKRIVSLLAALMMCIAPTAYAEEAAETAAVQDGQDQQTGTENNWSIELPSGITVASFEMLYSDVGTFETASAQIGLFSDERILFKSSSGHTDIKHGTVPDDDSVYDWGSISKTFVWVSVMQLWEQGLIDLDRDIREYLPDGFFRHLRYDDPITMINLMDHDAGWQENSEPMFKDDPADLLSLGDELRAVEPIQTHRPGEVASYSNYGAALAGYIVELVSGQDYTEYVHEHILSPLGMEHTAIGAAHT
ncbi:MAG: serine hydrolase, partial [Oscillospiraceae bacterium]|nr:serine hydrolase [Oscillospiraceae bacterium]